MKILFIGRGVIATQYAWVFEKEGHEVQFYVRPGRVAQYKPYVELDILDGRNGARGKLVNMQWPVKLIENIDPEDHYDLMAISVNHYQMDSAIQVIAPVVGNATVLLFNNLWGDMEEIAAPLPREQVIWGFPGAGGGYHGDNLLGGFAKTFTLEPADSAASRKRHDEVVELFEHAGFTIEYPQSMQAWYWDHFLLNAAMGAVVCKSGSFKDANNSIENVEQTMLLMQELIPLIQLRGQQLEPSSAMMLQAPSAMIAQKMFEELNAEDNVMGQLNERLQSSPHSTPAAMSHQCRDVWKTVHELGYDAPRFENMAQYFKHK